MTAITRMSLVSRNMSSFSFHHQKVLLITFWTPLIRSSTWSLVGSVFLSWSQRFRISAKCCVNRHWDMSTGNTPPAPRPSKQSGSQTVPHSNKSAEVILVGFAMRVDVDPPVLSNVPVTIAGGDRLMWGAVYEDLAINQAIKSGG